MIGVLMMDRLPNSNMSEFWNGDGGQNWVYFQKRMDVSLAHFGQEAMARAALSVGESVLDIGCGCGDTSFALSRRVGPGGHVLGIDISAPILTQARARSDLVAQDNLIFECTDAQTHSFTQAAFDVVFSRFGVMFFDDPITAFSNIRQALKPGGRIALICWQTAICNEWVSLPFDVVANHLALPAPPGPDEPGAFSFGDTKRVHHVLTRAGYSDISIDGFEAPFNVGSKLEEAVAFLTRMGPASGVVSQPEVDELTRFRITTELGDALEPYVTKHGVVLDAATWIITARKSF